MESKTTKGRPTIYDLAKLAEVSPGTVSRVLNNKDRVKASTRQKVLNAAQELGLKPQASVRSKQIAIITDPRFVYSLRGYSAILTLHLSVALSQRNIGVFVPENPIEQLEGYFLDGIIAVQYDRDILEMLHQYENRIPTVYIDNFSHKEGEYAVCSDHYTSGKIAAQYLVQKGKTKLGFVAGVHPPALARKQGYSDGIREAGLEINESYFGTIGQGANIYSAVTKVVRSGADSIFVPGTSLEAIRAMHIIQYVMGLKIPDDISIIGGENIGVNEHMNPPLTSILVPLQEMAAKAVEMIIALTEGEQVPENKVVLPVQLLERDSVV